MEINNYFRTRIFRNSCSLTNSKVYGFTLIIEEHKIPTSDNKFQNEIPMIGFVLESNRTRLCGRDSLLLGWNKNTMQCRGGLTEGIYHLFVYCINFSVYKTSFEGYCVALCFLNTAKGETSFRTRKFFSSNQNVMTVFFVHTNWMKIEWFVV